jgi:hypothetical protein
MMRTPAVLVADDVDEPVHLTPDPRRDQARLVHDRCGTGAVMNEAPRRFNRAQRAALYLAADGRCESCGRELEVVDRRRRS